MPKIIYLDFETYYDSRLGYTLRKQSTRDYIMDPRFELTGFAYAEGDDPVSFFPPSSAQRVFDAIDWDDTFLVCHNMRFDGAILKWHYGKMPSLYCDTMCMASAFLLPDTGSVSLATLADYLKLPVRKGSYIQQMDGVKFDDIQDMLAFASYSMDDIKMMRMVFKALMKYMPLSELRIIDLVQRMYIDPTLVLDQYVLAEHLADTRAEKEKMLASMGLDDRSEVRSNPKFANILRSLGVEPPMKLSSTTGKATYAFAKNDTEFRSLANHPDVRVQTAVATRLSLKSTLEETRAERLLDIARIYSTLAVPLRYYGAHTGRLSGDEKLNLQNLTRGSRLRDSILAPEGHMLVVADAAQIEARMLAWLAGQHDLVQQFRQGEDVYASFASLIYGHKITKASHPKERFVGKTGILGLGYGCGADKFELMLKTNKEMAIDVDWEEVYQIVQTYRQNYPNIVELWRRADSALINLIAKQKFKLGPCLFSGNGVWLPNKMKIFYHDLKRDEAGDMSYRFGRGKREQRRKIYGAKAVENIIQALARIAVMDAAIRIHKAKPHWKLALQVHDELVYVVPENEADEALSHVVTEMRTPPDWCSDCPLDAEGSTAISYGQAK